MRHKNQKVTIFGCFRYVRQLMVTLLLIVGFQGNVYAVDEQTAALGEHLKEMRVHMVMMRKMLSTGTECQEIERHVSKMTDHMEMMVDMMEKMHADSSDKDSGDHKMNHG